MQFKTQNNLYVLPVRDGDETEFVILNGAGAVLRSVIQSDTEAKQTFASLRAVGGRA